MTERPEAGRPPASQAGPGRGLGAEGESSVSGVVDALGSFATGVVLMMLADGRDDIGTTVTAFCPVSLAPPLVMVSLIADSYPAEVLGRVDRFAVAGRPGARIMLEGVPHRRGGDSGALIVEHGLAALECEAVQRVPAGDHLLVIASVRNVPYVAAAGAPLIRFAGRYPALR